MDNINVLLADDHTVLRKGLRVLLEREEDITVVGEAGDGLEACKLAHSLQPDILVLDLSMPGLSGLECAARLKAELPTMRILVLTMYDDADYLRRILALGAEGYILKKALDSELLSAIRAIHRGEMYIYPSLSANVWKTGLVVKPMDQARELSEREMEVLEAIVLGCTNEEIAKDLHISIKTVETHRKRIMEKLGLSKRSELVRYALRFGLVRWEK